MVSLERQLQQSGKRSVARLGAKRGGQGRMELDPYQTAPRYLNQASKPQAACIMLDCHRHVVFCARPIGISRSNQPGHVQNRCHSPLSRSRSICDKGSPRARLRIPYTRQKFLPILCYAPCSRNLALLQVGFLRLNYHSRLTRYVAVAVRLSTSFEQALR